MDKVLVSVDGAAGQPGSQFYDRRDNPAPPGRVGENGRSASPPSPGSSAGTISLRLSSPQVESHSLHAEGTGEWAGKRWDIVADRGLFLSARGGDGGAGGRGEDGQHGSAGVNGQDSSQYQDATHGGPGERGGDAGAGTSGGDGGYGGIVEIEVSEHDTNLLLAVDWDISGGAGGASGIHGRPGEGGQGGVGGAGCSWQVHDGVGYACCGGGRICTCKKYNQVTLYSTHARPPGNHGHQGFYGSPPITALSAGTVGAQGSVQIKVKSSNGMDSVYPGKYHLSVVSFEVVDENGDMIMEPGEHIIVRNICVQNSGSMPSPAHAQIPILIKPGDWLDPLCNEPAFLPTSIFPGETVSVRGEVRAFIRQEGALRYPGVVFAVTEDLQLTATMPGINRALPDFFQPTQINIRYPLELEAPCTLRSVERGNNVTFSWRLWNISSKPYGVNGLLRRPAATCLSEIGGNQIFTFPGDDSKTGPTRGLDGLDLLAPGSSITISQTFRVSDRADQYSTGALNLELLLSEPGDKEHRFSTLESPHRPLRSIMHYPIEVQISARYSYNPDSSFLLVVNAETKPEVIHQTTKLIGGDLELGMDVWNLSVYGNFINPLTGKCVLFEYVGKSVIIFANPFEYFGKGVRSAFGLLDPFTISYLAAAETQFLFPETTANDASLGPWFSALVFPTYPPERGSVELERKVLIATINCEQRNGRLSAHTYGVKTQLLKNPKALVTAEIKRTAKLLNEYLPLHRFSVAPIAAPTKKIAGSVFVRQGLPRASRVMATFGRWDIYSGSLSNFNTYMIVALLPFKTRARIFWDRVGGEILDPAADGTVPLRPLKTRKFSAAPVDAIELDSAALYPPPQGKTPESGQPPLTRIEIEHKLYIAICLSITYEIELEVSRFCSEAPWPDVIPETNCLFQLEKLEYLVSLVSNPAKLEIPSEFELMVETLGCVVATTQPTGAGQFIGQKMIRYGNRQTHLRVQLLEKLDAALHAIYTEKVAMKLKRKILRACDKTKEEVARMPAGTVAGAILSRLGGFAGEHYTTAPFFDASTMKGQSEAWGDTEAASRMAVHSDALGRIGNDEAHSRAMLNEMMKIL